VEQIAFTALVVLSVGLGLAIARVAMSIVLSLMTRGFVEVNLR
jgi:hypothetical protein